MKTVIILQRILKQYRVDFYNLLRETLLKNNIKLVVIHGREFKAEKLKNDAGSLDWAIEIKNLYLPFGFVWQPCLRHTKDADLIIVEQANKYLINYFFMARRMFLGKKIAFFGHGITRQSGVFSLNNILKGIFLKNVDWWFAYTKGVADYIISKGYPKDRITFFQNTIDTKNLIENKNKTSKEELYRIREKIGLGDGPVGIFCGAMYPEKRIRFLLDACQLIKKDVPGFKMIFMGAGEDDYLVKNAAKVKKWIHYVGPVFGHDKILYFMLSDLILMPGLVGLIVLDSFALETPIVTTSYPYHSPEIEYIENGINGIITKNDLHSFAEAVKDILLSSEMLKKLKNGCRRSLGLYTLENMTDRFVKGITACLNYYERKN